ncbi:hypothetical protein B0T22DRAFT_74758 [Podospora appendiculata]|uniref:Glycoside Hydrolase Family 76 n=1 Tax=Podospora appendiculata TaxID=314037 RepID=A0AAE1CHJ4_9PEZI|nr:hypothetical protein B0T22DRAFT_74758 [Podospora appendiculata]
MMLIWATVVVFAPTVFADSLDFLPTQLSATPRDYVRDQLSSYPDVLLYGDTYTALQVLQDAYYEAWVGTWPTAIDWTAAVIATHVTGALQSLSEGLELIRAKTDASDYWNKENTISRYFTQLIGFYFGQDAFSIRNQAFDDMLWVVLGWLDTIRFIKSHDASHSFTISRPRGPTDSDPKAPKNESWHGSLWSPAFAHRARIFWDLSETGWDTKLCGGGMTWNPRLLPYKNAITNELFIAASINMYLHFPGDTNTAPFKVNFDPESPAPPGITEWPPHDPKYLKAATDGYKWLTSSNMTNAAGLYTDGFHISGYPNAGNNNTKCDQRDEMVYTYNQGVLLTGQLGLFRVTGDPSYLRDGHRLIQAVIRATGYDLETDRPVDRISRRRLPPWRGLGRAGILEDACDAKGTCSQDGQTFKGIWMHHFTTFCAPLEPLPSNVPAPAPTASYQSSFEDTRTAHAVACQRYVGWLSYNAMAARGTRDSDGKFGMWWTVGLFNITAMSVPTPPDAVPHTPGAVDYRNNGVPNDPVWMTQTSVPLPPVREKEESQHRMSEQERRSAIASRDVDEAARRDPNRRGRGRTVETQGGGLAVLRALWEVSKQGLV